MKKKFCSTSQNNVLIVLFRNVGKVIALLFGIYVMTIVNIKQFFFPAQILNSVIVRVIKTDDHIFLHDKLSLSEVNLFYYLDFAR